MAHVALDGLCRGRLLLAEIPVAGYDARPWNGVTDYCLYDFAGDVLAVVEAKRCSRNPREADEQLRDYVTQIAKRQSYAPFGFMANGSDIWFWQVGLANPRLVAGFFTPDDLQRLLFLRQHARSLESVVINTTIVDRIYQHEAIRRICEAFAAHKRRAPAELFASLRLALRYEKKACQAQTMSPFLCFQTTGFYWPRWVHCPSLRLDAKELLCLPGLLARLNRR